MEILFVFLLAAAVRGLVQQTRRDLDRWNRRPSKPRGPGWWRRLTASGIGYWLHQALHGFPSARAGLADGVNRAREAHHRARRDIAQGRAEHAEGRAELHPELETYRERRRRALEDLERQRAEREEREHQEYLAMLERRRERDEARRRREEERAEAEREPAPEPADPSAAEAEMHSSPDDPPGGSDEETSDPPGGDHDEEDPVADWDGPLPGEDNAPSPEQPAGQNQGDNMSTGTGEVTYASVKARMRQTVTDAEQRQAEAQEAVQATEEHLAWTQGAKAEAGAMADEMQALEVDPATLGAMSEHLDALDAAERAAVELQEQAVANKAAWDKVLETAQQVSSQMEASGHGNLDEAHANAAAGGGKKEFYGEG